MVFQGDLLVLHDGSVLFTQNRQEHFIFQLGLDRMPINIEERRIMGTRSVF
jgi:hypothetical protein